MADTGNTYIGGVQTAFVNIDPVNKLIQQGVNNQTMLALTTEGASTKLAIRSDKVELGNAGALYMDASSAAINVHLDTDMNGKVLKGLHLVE